MVWHRKLAVGWALSSGNQRREEKKKTREGEGEGEGAWIGSDVPGSHFACSGIRKLNETLWANASHIGWYRTANMQASTGQHTGSVRSVSKTHTPALPPQFLQGGRLGNLPLIGTLNRIRREEEEKKETGRKQQSVWIATGNSTLWFSLPVKLFLERWSEGGA